MDFNFITNIDTCYFVVPPLLYYSHIPTAIISLLLGIFIFLKAKRSVAVKLLLSILVLFSLWSALDLVLWLSPDSRMVLFFWSFINLIQMSITILIFYFAYVFLERKNPPFWAKLFFSSLLFVYILFIPTSINLPGFNISICEAMQGSLTGYYYSIEIVTLLFLLFYLVKKIITVREQDRGYVLYFILGIIFFTASFSGANLTASLLSLINPDNPNNWLILQYGLFGMPIFTACLAYIIVKYKIFNIKVLGAQILMFALGALVFAMIFLREIEYVRVIASISVIFIILIGIALIRSVKREVQQREKIEKLAGELQTANEGQANLIHIINHQIKGYLVKARNVFSELLTEPEYEPISESAKPMMNEGLRSLTEGVDFVTDFLNASNIEKGTYKYEMQQFDMKTFVQSMVEKQKNTAEGKGLSFELRVDEGDYNMRGDKIQLGQAVRNLIDNSIRYTPKGSIKLQLTLLRQGSAGQAINNKKILFKIEDTGVGISDELKPKLFTKGGRDENSLKVNINSTGFGLSFVKGVVEAHRGRVWVESAGVNKGSTFFMELPVSFN